MYLKGEGRSEEYKEVAQQWPGKIQRPTEPDKNFDMDGIDLQRISPNVPEQKTRSIFYAYLIGIHENSMSVL